MTVKHILFPFDFSSQGTQALPFVEALASRYGAKVTVLGVVPPVWDLARLKTSLRMTSDRATDWVHELKAKLDQAFVHELNGVLAERIAISGDPASHIVDVAHANDVDLIMMPTHGAGRFRTLLIGSVTAKVLHDATCAVWTATHAVEQCSRPKPRTVLCALEGTPGDRTLVQHAAALCKQLGASLKLLHVVGPISDWPSLGREHALQDEVRQRARVKLESMRSDVGIHAPLRVVLGEIVQTVTDEARQEDADLIVMGRRTQSGALERFRTHMYGIIQQSPCPVLSLFAPMAAEGSPVAQGLRGESQPCAHAGCGCRVALGGPHWPYCSEHCMEAAALTELRCDCQHAACRQI